jgi:DNA-binding NtrC family response regulator
MPTPPSAAPAAKIPPGKAAGYAAFHPTVEVLLVARAGNTRAMFAQTFESSNWRLQWAATPAEALLRLRDNPMAVLIFEDHDPPSPSLETEPWLQLLEETRRLAHPPKVIIASRQADDRMWAEVLHQGGYDVLPLPLESGEVVRTVSMAWLEWRHEHETEAAEAPRAMAMGAGS